MQTQELEQRLSRIPTQWTLLRQAHAGPQDAAAAARQDLMQRYCGAVYRYLLAAVRDPHAAEDLTQDFALRFVQGRFRLADPGRGRFRDYVKTALFHLVDSHRRRQGRQPRGAAPEGLEVADPAGAPLPDSDAAFEASWRKELLARAWAGLQALEQATGNAWYTTLRFHADNPGLRSHEVAERLTALLGRPITAVNVRQTLHRARDTFAALLVYEVRQSLEGPTRERLEQELIDLGLYEYCRPAVDRARLAC
jgi:RNA polymerase sigma-70 factor (ECF subfamily)